MISALHMPYRKNRDVTRDMDDDSGFTLIELLVVVVILGILIAIAIPVYLNYRKSANDKAAQSDLRGAISTLEVCSSDGSYPKLNIASGTDPSKNGGPLTGCGTADATTVSLSSGTTIVYYPDSTTAPTKYIIEARNSGGSGTGGKIYCYASLAGGTVKGIAATSFVNATADACPA